MTNTHPFLSCILLLAAGLAVLATLITLTNPNRITPAQGPDIATADAPPASTIDPAAAATAATNALTLASIIPGLPSPARTETEPTPSDLPTSTVHQPAGTTTNAAVQHDFETPVSTPVPTTEEAAESFSTPTHVQLYHTTTGLVLTTTQHDIRPTVPGKVSDLHPDWRATGMTLKNETLFTVDNIPHRAPADAVFLTTDLDDGETVNQGQRGCRLADLERFEIHTPLPTNVIHQLQDRQPDVLIRIHSIDFLGYLHHVTNQTAIIHLPKPHTQTDLAPAELIRAVATVTIPTSLAEIEENEAEEEEEEEEQVEPQPTEP